MTIPLVRTDRPDPGIAVVTLDSPATRNALSDELMDQLLAALEAARDDDTVRVVVITSSHDRIFSAGGDLKAFADDRSPDEKFEGLGRFPRLYRLLGALGKPVVCAANGDVLAGAFGLALACDLVIAKESTRFGCPEINVGVFPFMISALIYRNVDRMKANELMMVGDLVTAAEGRDFGFVNRVVPDADFDAAVLAWARRIAAKSPLLMRLGKEAIDATRDLPLGEALDVLQRRLADAFGTDDMKEGVTAFREKRDPVWSLR
ncbi:enoyl-CoA hydratase [Subtercola boreus]|uniref:Enoyl-CoA hydratase n=1 Tax=Subtercola boreus TaxID=120213 RepID=A0A3E0VKJ7_9MICO|nr:enoyl-CoA hydratase/isomerase family protein [Subtercola boreus]RFA10492.1 enoyl-CoA hydratase [Subtercola boreus]TQL55971.1 enoyl-CoA hydratase/carnithine racemase [Subtercola boreus]